MNPIRGIARRITHVISGVNPPETYLVLDWIVQPPLITSINLSFSDAFVSDNFCLIIAESRLSANLLLQIPEAYEILEPFAIPETAPYTNVRVASPEITELTDWLIQAVACSVAFKNPLTVPESFLEELANFETLVLTEPKQFSVHLEVSQVLDNLCFDIEIPDILECCFNQDGCEDFEQQEFCGVRNNKEKSKGKALYKSPSFCEVIYPILLPPLSLEAHSNLDFYNPLRGYQKQGIKSLFESQSMLLADEMGTGKTVQAVNALRLLFRQARIKSVLIVCPPAVIGSIDLSIKIGNSEGWSGHFYHWATELKFIVMRGGKKEQRRMDWQKPFHIYITTYDTLRADLTDEVLTDLYQFDCIVLDEAQKVKNRDTKTAKSIRRLQANYRWALTGTPIENRLDDVISLFDFIRPGTFSGGVEYTSQHVSNTIEPFMLRRLKQDVLQDLPDKERQEAWLDLNDDQRTAYNQALEAGREKIEISLDGEQPSQIKQHIFALLTKLKQICNFATGRLSSPKVDMLLDLLETIVANQRKVLIFSQYRTEGADKIAQVLAQAKIGYVFYQGTEQQKDQAVSDFRNRPEITVFLATLATAGYGITLTEATYVIHFDHPWNPAKMQNAEDRVHRIGQTKGVTIYSFWMKNTIDEKIKKKLIDKRILIDNTINSLAVSVDEESLISTEDWLDMFDIKISKKVINDKKVDQKTQARRAAMKTVLQNSENKLAPPASSSNIISVLEQIKRELKTIKDSSKHVFTVYGNYIEQSVKELTIMTEQSPIFNQQNATIGVNYAASGSKQEFTQNVTETEQNFEVLLTDFERFINDLQQKHPNATDETAIQVIDVEAKEIQRIEPLRWEKFLNLKRLWNGGKKAAFKVGEHYSEQNPFVKGGIAFLEGVMEEPK